MKRMSELTWEEIRRIGDAGGMIVLPIGSFEQHGPHLPVKTDTFLAGLIAEAALESLDPDLNIVVAPTFWAGASQHHLPFFAFSLKEQTLIDVLTQLGTSAAEAGFKRFFILNGHGGNSAPIMVALKTIRNQKPELLTAAADYWRLSAEDIRRVRDSVPGGIAHGGELETSLMMHLDADSVRADKIEATLPTWPREFILDLVDSGSVTIGIDKWQRISEKGALGDPQKASVEKGALFFKGIIDSVARSILAFYHFSF